MKVKVDKKVVAKLQLDLKGFEQEFKKDFNLEEAFKHNIKVVEYKYDNKEKLKHLVYLSADWGNIFMLYDQTDRKVLDFDVYKCEIEGVITYVPGVMDTDKGIFHLDETKSDKTEFMIVTSHNDRVDKHLEHMLAQNLVDFVNFEWKMMFDLDEPSDGR